MPERLLSHYRLQERLGAGAMGEVWLAEDLRLHRTVALKTLRPDARDAEAAGRLLREARLASTLTHPNVAVVYEVGEAEADGESTAFIAMEYVRGRTLAELAAGGSLGAASVVPLARQIAEALAEAHERGIVHRDVKPGNVMVNERGQVKVLDFGLACFTPPAGGESATWSGTHAPLAGAFAGTPAYMSPEQLRGLSLDAQSDVFSLGVVLYELLAGRRPFDASNAVALTDAILREPAAPLPDAGPLAAGLTSLVLRMLAKDKERRPAGMRQVCRELDEIAAGQVPAVSHAPALAVVAFANLTARAEDDWLGAGLAETVAAGLAELPQVSVVSRERIAEALRERGAWRSEDAPLALRIGRELGARYVVTGGYQSLGPQVRITASILETGSERVLHTAKIDGRREDLFEAQDRLLAELSSGLRGRRPLRPVEETQDLAAYEAFAKGLVNLEAESHESLDRAIVFFERAIALDPGYARAHMLLGAALDVKGDYLGMPAVSERALARLDEALRLRPQSAEAWRRRGSVLVTMGRDEEALAAFEHALQLDPTEASAHAGVGRVHFVLRGDFERAIPAYERALALNPKAGWAALQLAHCAALARDFPRAERAARLAVELQAALLSGQPGLVIVGAHVRLGQAFALQERWREALEQFAAELGFLKTVDHALRGRIFIELQQRIGEAQLRLGETAAARAALDLALEAYERRRRSGATDQATGYYAACAHALLEEREPALACLEEAARQRPRLTAARAPREPALEVLRGEPRFEAVLAPDRG